MEIYDWAISILSSASLEDKLYAPSALTDANSGAAIFWKEPSRHANMRLSTRKKEDKLPPLHELGDQDKRAVCLHRFAGHELLAVEIMAYALLAFPGAPKRFRRGLAATLKEEQKHVRLYMKRLNEMGLEFGDLPLYRHFWAHTPFISSPLHFVSVMNLTFEQANLDFAPIYGKCFLRHGDEESAKLMAQILKDEISHVRFGWHWLKKLKGNLSEWDAWTKTLANTLLTPKRAKGFFMHPENRQKAGIPKEWIDKINSYSIKA